MITPHSALQQVIVQRTEEKVDAGAQVLQGILKAGAEDDGEFLVPLSNAKAAGTCVGNNEHNWSNEYCHRSPHLSF